MLQNKTGLHPYREFIMRRFLRRLRIWGPQPPARWGPQPHAFTKWRHAYARHKCAPTAKEILYARRKRAQSAPTIKEIMITAVTK